MIAKRVPLEMCRREAVVQIFDAVKVMGIRTLGPVDKEVRLTEAYAVLDDQLYIRLDYGYRTMETVIQDVPKNFFEKSLFDIAKVLHRMIGVLPSVQLARRREFKLRKMKARSRARTWRMPWLRRRNIWIGV